MRILVKHYLVSKGLEELPDRKVTVEVVIPEEAGGEDVQGPIDLTLGQQLTLEVAASEFEYPGGGIEGCFPAISDTQIQAVLDTERLVAPGPPVEPDGYQRHGEDAAERDELVTIVPRRGEEGRSIELEYDPEAKLVQFVKWGEEVFGAVHPIEPEEWAIIAAAFAAPALTPEEARTLHAVWAGDAFDAQFLESVQPKLEAIAGESWR